MAFNHGHLPKSLVDLPITSEHRLRLQWFLDHEGAVVPYSDFSEHTEPWLISPAKGIYRPKHWNYSLSIKETLNSPYGDVPIMTLANGDWVYRYHRERGENRASNIGLLNCLSDGIPVGVSIQVEPKPNVRYFIAGLGLIRQFQDPWFDLVNWHGAELIDVIEQLIAETHAEYDETQKQGKLPGFIADSDVEQYAKQLVRPNQQMFRVMLLSSYEKTCAVTETRVIPALEAAHIRPYSNEKIDRVQNGLLLRADIHRLFDRGYLGINTSYMETVLSPKLIGSEYEQYSGQSLILPTNKDLLPSIEYLDEHRERWKLS